MSATIPNNSNEHDPTLQDQIAPTPAQEEEADSSDEESLGLSPKAKKLTVFGLLVVVLVPIFLMLSGNVELLAQNFLQQFSDTRPEIDTADLNFIPARKKAKTTFTFQDLDLHPDQRYQPYFGASLDELDPSDPSSSLIPAFRNLMNLYIQRQAKDDNFTVRIVDNRNDEVLEVFELSGERLKYKNSESKSWDWGRVDRLRRQETTRLVKKYQAEGIPKPAITVKWGRANQIAEARMRDEPFIEYEANLARYLGLSLLITEIGTVETFNQDKLVSSVGARSRYQMMPYILRQNDINHYTLKSAFGNTIPVYEEWHTLLSMEPAFTLLKGYINAVGHEVPGISAYHTGPGNLFKLLRMYLADESTVFTPKSTVMDAYMWAVTDGYPEISRKTSFKGYSRGYVPSGYGALRATDMVPVDPALSFRGERVQLMAGKQVFLSELLRVLDESDADLEWGPSMETLSLYERFQKLNPHIVLPDANEENTVPEKGDVRLVAEADNASVRFFLPLGATDVLAANGLNVIDASKTFRFDENTYVRDGLGEKTVWDLQYEQLVANTANFGFSQVNRRKLVELKDKFEELAEENPSHYRLMQRKIIKSHLSLWSYDGWDQLASATTAAKGAFRLPTLPPTPVESTVPTPTTQ